MARALRSLLRVFVDAFLPNLLLFACGQAAAIAWMRTGMATRGVVAMVMIWVLADVALLSRFAFGLHDVFYQLPLLGMQLWAAFEAVAFPFLRLRARFSPARRRRHTAFAAAHQLYLRDDGKGAAAAFARLRHVDPWDVAAAVAQANALLLCGQPRAAVRLLRKARGLDLRAEYRDFIDERLRQLLPGKAQRSGA